MQYRLDKSTSCPFYFTLHSSVANTKDMYYQTKEGKELIAQWDGLRLTFGLGFKF